MGEKTRAAEGVGPYKIKTCPFCGETLVWTEWECSALPGCPILRYFKHSQSACFLSGAEVTPDDAYAWNMRRTS